METRYTIASLVLLIGIAALFIHGEIEAYRDHIRNPRDLLKAKLRVRYYPNGRKDFFLDGDRCTSWMAPLLIVHDLCKLHALGIKPVMVAYNKEGVEIPQTEEWKRKRKDFEDLWRQVYHNKSGRVPRRIYDSAPYAFLEYRYEASSIQESLDNEPAFS